MRGGGIPSAFFEVFYEFSHSLNQAGAIEARNPQQLESNMTLRDGRPVREIVYSGNGFARAKLWITAKNNHASGYSQWQQVSLDLLPQDFLRDMREAAEATLQHAA